MSQNDFGPEFLDFTDVLKQVKLDLCAEDLMDILWLANQTGEIPSIAPDPTEDTDTDVDVVWGEDLPLSELPPPDRVAVTQRDSAPAGEQQTRQSPAGGIAVSAPAAPALRTRLELGRALRPLMRKVAALNRQYLDEDATANQIAEQDVWLPVMRPAAERWLELALVVEETDSMPIWRSLIQELRLLTERQGAFRTVQSWRLTADESGQPQLFSGNHAPRPGQRSRSPKELIDPAGRRLILVVSDCTSALWRQSQLYRWLELWENHAPTTVMQLLPQRLWERSALGEGTPVWVKSLTPGTVTANWQVEAPLDFLMDESDGEPSPATLTVPVVTVEPNSIKPWARVLVGAGEARAAAVQFDWSNIPPPPAKTSEDMEPLALVRRFRGGASIVAQRLAGMMAAVPVSPEITDLLRQTLLPEARQVHVAEVFMSGLIRMTRTEKPEGGHSQTYDFVSEKVRDLLTDAVDVPTTEKVLDTVSAYLSERWGLGTRTFEALLTPDLELSEEAEGQVLPFAYLARRTLQRMGQEYAELVELLGQPEAPQSIDETHAAPTETEFSPLKTFEFEVARFVSATVTLPELRTKEFEVVTVELESTTAILKPFEFETATIAKQDQRILFGLGPQRTRWQIEKQQGQGRQLVELLGDDLTLEMVWVPSGSFIMGSPTDEPERTSDEGPQHEVAVSSFLIGRYPVTQAQWRFVAGLQRIQTKLNPGLSNKLLKFEGHDLPVIKVSWNEAQEFCQRLSAYTQREYRIPSESEWEYACRAETKTPFHFGEMITTDLANYNGSEVYNNGPTGQNRDKTTRVGSFPANKWGISDMHGNVWEWCEDMWHSNYEGAPIDGSAWTQSDDKRPVMRGGSWFTFSRGCRSAYREPANRSGALNYVGFRVCLSTSSLS
ncbi:formylglycine-generating enzyme family protein [Leptolyngbya iicbica]|uniref:Formylglycine-generating enzyme family protein n=2 Tax=Cyanophyceae TaxID=3028117 RepID=A0A4Q7EAB7_9CYAN|nr:formylglycine-generating enzyme family protein [Leptolyngbya sp. LK]RZM79548.1 formylglycine-generating enzyme family protein [Leptolyngbya sp. LK]